MRNLFHEHFKQSPDDLKVMWKSCLFSFDANVLLNLYRYSSETRQIYFDILKNINSKIFITYHAAKEYFENRIEVIIQQDKAYRDTVSKINDLKSAFQNKRQHPFLSEGILTEFENVTERAVADLNSKQAEILKRITDDEIQIMIAELFNEKIPTWELQEKAEEIRRTGEERYKKRTPPGYKDAKKEQSADDKDDLRKYGDLIVWLQLMDHCKKENKDLVFVTDDKKEDWWQIIQGKTIGPRPELLKEFRSVTGQKIHLYTPDKFAELSFSKDRKSLNAEVVSEIREISVSAASQRQENQEHLFPTSDIENDPRIMAKYNRRLRKKVERGHYLKRQLQILNESKNSITDYDMILEKLNADIATNNNKIQFLVEKLEGDLSEGVKNQLLIDLDENDENI